MADTPMTDAAASTTATPTADEKKKEMTLNQRKRKYAKIIKYLKNHPWQLKQERALGRLEHIKPKKQKAEGAEKKVERKLQKKKLPVPETVMLRQKARIRRMVAARREQIVERKKVQEFRKIYIKRAQEHLADYAKRERYLVSQRRFAKRSLNFFREPDAKLIFVIRLKGIMGLTPRTRKILRLLRLRQINNGTFVRVNKAILQMLRLVDPYVAYGYPNLATVRKLLYKRGFARLHGQRIPIIDNKIICHKLGRFGILCMEDLIHEIYTVGPHFKHCNKFLWAFKLNNPRGGFVRKSKLYVEGGDGGNREEKINLLIRRML